MLNNDNINSFTEELDRKTLDVVNYVFRELSVICPAFKQAWPNQDDFNAAKRSWLKAFMLSGMNDMRLIEHGLNKMRLKKDGAKWIPSSGEFIAMCKISPEDLGIPDIYKAWKETIRNLSLDKKVWSHPVIEHAYLETTSYVLKNKDEKTAFSMFQRNYEIAVRMLMNNEPLKKIDLAITKDESIIQTPDIAKKSINGLKEILGMKC